MKRMNNFIINKEDGLEKSLSKEYYFESLLQAIHSKSLFNHSELEIIQLQLLELITEIVGYFTKGASSSVREEVAEQIMLSINYTIGLALKSQLTIKESIELIDKKDLKFLFSKGEKILKDKVKECLKTLDLIKETRVQTENYAYIDTIDYGIPLFFKKYDTRFASHETPGSIDYPLAVDVIDLVGVEYIEEYLNKLLLENKFCSYFDVEEIKVLLKGYIKNSKHMLMNIYQLVLTNYLGSIMAGNRGKSLEITRGNREYLKSIIEGLSPLELDKLFSLALEKLFLELSIEDKDLIEYIDKTLSKIVPEIKINIETNTLEKVFITISKSKKNVIKYEDGLAVNNSRFRVITEEIRDCSSVEDKIKIIREEIHSLKDLMDVLGADCIFDEEFFTVFKVLDDFELALIIKNISDYEILESYYGTGSEKEWHKKFKAYLECLDDIKKEEIINLSQSIEF